MGKYLDQIRTDVIHFHLEDRVPVTNPHIFLEKTPQIISGVFLYSKRK